MKTILSLLLLLLVSLHGFGQKYTIEGTLPDHSSDGQYLVLYKRTFVFGEKKVVIDSVKVKDGRFLFKGKTKETPFPVHLVFSKGLGIPHFFILESGEIKITVNLEGELNCSGTPLNEEYNQAMIIPSQIVRRVDSLGARKNKVMFGGGVWTEDEELRYRAALPLQQMKVSQEKRWEFIEKHIQFPELIIHELYSYEDSPIEKDPRIDKVLAQLPESYMMKIHQEKEAYQEAKAEYIKKHGMLVPKYQYVENTPEAVKVGKQFSDFSGETSDGKQITLSEVVKNNKLVLIDFWASWCGPCMQEMPNIAELYRQYKDKGLEIIGISSDQSAQRWTETIQKRNMTWPQIRSAGEDRIGSTYGIKFIPYTILIDQNGIIIARKLKGEELQQKVKEILE